MAGAGAVNIKNLVYRHRNDDRGFELSIPSFELGSGETAAIIGASGSGKSTLMKIIAGLAPGFGGSVEIFGAPCLSPAGARRRDLAARVAVMFQDAPLFRGSVFENVAMGPSIAGESRAAAGERAGEALAMVGIGDLASADVRSVSGGQARRVCLARALAMRPELLLLDEPLYSVDPVTKDEIIKSFQRYRAERNCASIIVTHDRNEALAVSERAVVMDSGAILQDSTFYECLENPRSEKVARFLGRGALVYGKVSSCEDGLCAVACHASAGGRLNVMAAGDFAAGESVCLVVNPDDIAVRLVFRGDPPAASTQNCFRGVVHSHMQYEFGVMVFVEAGKGIVFPAYITRRSFSELAVAAGLEVEISFKATSVTVLRLGK